MFYDSHREMGPIVDKACDVVLGHLRKLFLENTLQACEDNEAIVGTIVVDDTELNVASAFFKNGGL